MIEFAALDLFKDNPDLAQPWKDIARQKVFHEAVVHCLARMSWDGASAEQLAGARKFITHFLNCAEAVEAISVSRVPRLDYDVEAKVAARNAVKKE